MKACRLIIHGRYKQVDGGRYPSIAKAKEALSLTYDSRPATISVIVYVDEGHEDGTKYYTFAQALREIKRILKDDKDLLRGRKISSISVDDLIEYGSKFYNIWEL